MTEQVIEESASELETNQKLTANDRCDACGAQAYVRVKVGDSGELLFCAHHARKHSSALEKVAEVVQDETDQI
ncbi:hypothetical protein KRX54_04875 [Actinomycetaceae bacterium TAE3-ERU4]|nr:hypothetical protein [Actinomycetaceae bacterium TAE3-ERU4]